MVATSSTPRWGLQISFVYFIHIHTFLTPITVTEQITKCKKKFSLFTNI